MVKYEHIKSASLGLKFWFYHPNWLCDSVAPYFGLMEVYLPPTFFYDAGELIKSLMHSRHVLLPVRVARGLWVGSEPKAYFARY